MKGESMSYSLFIASRYLTSRSKRTFISIISFMSVLGVAIGVAALVIVMSVYNGVTEEMREKILGANPHVMVMSTQAGAFGPEAARGEGEVIERIRETPGVVSATPFLYAEVLLSTPQGATGLVVRGIDPVSAGESMPLLHHLESGSVDDLVRESGPAGMIVGHDLARRFNLRVGSRPRRALCPSCARSGWWACSSPACRISTAASPTFPWERRRSSWAIPTGTSPAWKPS